MTRVTLQLLTVVTVVGLIVRTATYRAKHVVCHFDSMSGTLDETLPVHNPFPNHSLFCRCPKLLIGSDLASSV